MMKLCGCAEPVFDDSENAVSVGTCPRCLPAGAITWLIENGRQLELFRQEEGNPLRGGMTRRDIERSIPSEKACLDETGLPF